MGELTNWAWSLTKVGWLQLNSPKSTLPYNPYNSPIPNSPFSHLPLLGLKVVKIFSFRYVLSWQTNRKRMTSALFVK